MTKIVFLTTLIFFTSILVRCSNPDQKGNIISDKETVADSCCIKNTIESSNKTSTVSEITCPECGCKKTDTLPTDVCVIKYTCDSCSTVSYSKDGDCCVFCSYGTHKCPSKQED